MSGARGAADELIYNACNNYVCARRFAADDWENPHPCNDDPEELENLWNIQNCVWLTVGAIMQQGCDLLPK